MADFVYRGELSPNAIAYLPNAPLPDADADLFDPVTMLGPSNRIGAMEIYFVSTVAGTLRLKRVANSVTTYETLNYGSPLSANQPASPQVIPFSGGETITLVYSGTGGTCYLTIADVSGDMIKSVRS